VREILLVKAGDTADAVRRTLGDYDRWFLRALANGSGSGGRAGWVTAASDSGAGGAGAGGAARCRLTVVEVHRGGQLPRGEAGFDGVLVTGSPHSVRDGAPWMKATAAWLRRQAERGVPVLGVCFGHQLLGVAFGARVARRADGREIGTISCGLTPAGRADPLFARVGGTFEAQATHEDELVDAPAELEVLASNAATRIQAFRVGDRVRGVQFHPELDAATMRALVLARAGALEAESRERGADPRGRVAALLAGIREAPAGRRILQAFVGELAGGAAPRSVPPADAPVA
jgi:GMP synthase (glutamine-hydrolysing)